MPMRSTEQDSDRLFGLLLLRFALPGRQELVEVEKKGRTMIGISS